MVDAHAHLYSGHRIDVALRSALDNLSRLGARLAAPSLERCLVIVDPAGVGGFMRLIDGAVVLGFEALPTGDPFCTTLRRGGDRLHLLAGRQLVTGEGVEVLALGTREALADGLPSAECLEGVRSVGALAVIPWSPGKWMGARGRVVRSLLLAAKPGDVLVGDVAIRPRAFPLPPLLRLARRRGLKMVAGSDPLPHNGEECLLGSYGIAAATLWDAESPGRAVLQLLAAGAPLAGRRVGALTGARRLVRHRWRRAR